MLQHVRTFVAVCLTITVLSSFAFSAPVVLGKIILNESPLEKFGALYFPFQFSAPLFVALCENGIDPAGGCVNSNISDVVCVTNNSAGEGVVAMISDLETSLSIGNLPPDFPCPAGIAPKFVAETGKVQVLSGKGIPAVLPTGATVLIKVAVMSALETTTSTVSDVLTVSTM